MTRTATSEIDLKLQSLPSLSLRKEKKTIRNDYSPIGLHLL